MQYNTILSRLIFLLLCWKPQNSGKFVLTENHKGLKPPCLLEQLYGYCFVLETVVWLAETMINREKLKREKKIYLINGKYCYVRCQPPNITAVPYFPSSPQFLIVSGRSNRNIKYTWGTSINWKPQLIPMICYTYKPLKYAYWSDSWSSSLW